MSIASVDFTSIDRITTSIGIIVSIFTAARGSFGVGLQVVSPPWYRVELLIHPNLRRSRVIPVEVNVFGICGDEPGDP